MDEISSLQNNTGLCSSDRKEEHEKAADEEEESRRQLQLADGGWMWSQRDRKRERNRKLSRKAEGGPEKT